MTNEEMVSDLDFYLWKVPNGFKWSVYDPSYGKLAGGFRSTGDEAWSLFWPHGNQRMGMAVVDRLDKMLERMN